MAQYSAKYDESKVPPLILPDPFVSEKGLLIQSVSDWEKIRRPELVEIFRREVYGSIPKDFDSISFQIASENQNPYPDEAELKEIDISVTRNGETHTMRLNLFLPKSQKSAAPIVLLINYKPADPAMGLVEEGFWPVKELIAKGIATASFHGETVAPDDPERFTEGVIGKLYPEELAKEDGMRTFGAWAWAAMRAMDYFETEPRIDTKKSAIVGHSRAGKTALWTGVNDTRWAVVIPNESGCGGAAISRRKFGETVKIINTAFPHWFNENFKKYNDEENTLPIDQHMLAMLVAPRALYFSSAREDRWADPKGEYLSMKLGSRVYSEIYGKEVSFPLEFEKLEEPIIQHYAGYHIREGKHNLTLEDWWHFIEFMELNFSQQE